MRTTVRLDETLLTQAKRVAAQRGMTLTALIEEGLRSAMAGPLQRNPRRKEALPVCSAGGGTLPGVDLDDSAALLDRMDRIA
jgi:hypothetical protein